MPYCRKSDPYEKSKMLLRAYDLTATRLSKVLGCTYPTAKKKLDNPGYITTDEWGKIHRKHHVPIEEIREVFLS